MPVLTLAQSAQSFGIWGEDWTNENTVGRKEDCRSCPPLFNSILFITSLHPRRSQKKKNNSTNTTMISSLWYTLSWSSDSTSCPERVPAAIGGSGWKPESSLMSAVLSCPLLGIVIQKLRLLTMSSPPPYSEGTLASCFDCPGGVLTLPITATLTLHPQFVPHILTRGILFIHEIMPKSSLAQNFPHLE